ncbi:MAG: beta-ketoacyl-[acyl-carrier-protein] synthase family protein [Proteobacteria bacterium]|nr:beta-ketoacyl-[acyl-carrier-protein] synthase family protein [Pseudomonadota bacterium]
MKGYPNLKSQDKKPPKRRVVVTGIGAITPLGHSMDITWDGIVNGRTPASPIQYFDASEFPNRIAYQVTDFSLSRKLLKDGEDAYLCECAEFAVNAAEEALEQSGLLGSSRPETTNPNRIQVCFGMGLPSPNIDWYEKVFFPKKLSLEESLNNARILPDQISSIIARMVGARGGISTVHTACASSGQALGEAFESIAYGDADLVVTGGADSMISPFYAAGFALLGALSKRNDDPKTASRPFDRNRDGFVFGEGACVLVFEEYDHACKRGALILGEVCGYGITESAYRITDLHHEGTGPIEAMQMALDDANLKPTDIGYINAHGTSTQLNDRIESLAISKVFGPFSKDTLVSSTKSMTGHTIAAAGALEFAFCLLALRHQTLPPSVNISSFDTDCLITLTAPEAQPRNFRFALSNSVGFGGSNTALIAGRIGR